MSSQSAVMILGWTFIARLNNADLIYCPDHETYSELFQPNVRWVCMPVDRPEQRDFCKKLKRDPLLKSVLVIGYLQESGNIGFQSMVEGGGVDALVLEKDLANWLEKETKNHLGSLEDTDPSEYSANPHFHLFKRLEAERKRADIENKLYRVQADYETLLEAAKEGARAVSRYDELKGRYTALESSYRHLKESMSDPARSTAHEDESAEHALEMMKMSLEFTTERNEMSQKIVALEKQIDGLNEKVSAQIETGQDDLSEEIQSKLRVLEFENHRLQNEWLKGTQAQLLHVESILKQVESKSGDAFDSSEFSTLSVETEKELSALEDELSILRMELGA